MAAAARRARRGVGRSATERKGQDVRGAAGPVEVAIGSRKILEVGKGGEGGGELANGETGSGECAVEWSGFRVAGFCYVK